MNECEVKATGVIFNKRFIDCRGVCTNMGPGRTIDTVFFTEIKDKELAQRVRLRVVLNNTDQMKSSVVRFIN